MDITRAVGPAQTPPPRPPPPPVTEKVMIFGQKNDRKPAVLGSPQPWGDATTHMTGTEPCGCNIANVIQRHSMSFIVITQ